MLEPQVKSVPTTCPLGMVGGGPHTIAARKQGCIRGLLCFLSVSVF